MQRRRFLKLFGALPLAALFGSRIPEPEYECGRCGKPIWDLDDAETCWWCTGPLCYECWEEYGHCGHPEAEAMNEYARSVPQPALTDDENWYGYLAHLFHVTDSAMLKLMEK